jgi:outer membrane protein TolC
LDFSETAAYNIRRGDAGGGINGGFGNGVFNGINNSIAAANSITTAALTPTPITSPLTQGQLPIAAPPLVITPSSVPTPAPMAVAASLKTPTVANEVQQTDIVPLKHVHDLFRKAAGTSSTVNSYVKPDTCKAGDTPVAANAMPTPRTQQAGSAITQLSASYLLFDFGVREGNFIAARENFFVASYLGQQSLQDIIFNTLEAYYQYINADAQRETAVLNLQDATTSYTAAKAQLEAGVVARTDLLQFQAQMSAAQLSVEQTRGQADIALALLMRIVGLPAHMRLQIAKPSAKAWEDSAIPQVEELINLALSWRSDLAATYANYKVAEGSLRAVQAEGWPVLNARANWMHTSIFQRPRNSTSQNFIAAVTLNVPLYRGGYYTARTKRARAVVEAAYANYVDTADQTMLNVVAAYHQFYTATGSL